MCLGVRLRRVDVHIEASSFDHPFAAQRCIIHVAAHEGFMLRIVEKGV